jgi:hypothetical protein
MGGMDKSDTQFLPDDRFRDLLADEYPDSDLLFMTEEIYDAAIIGVSVMCCGTQNQHQVIYDWDLVIKANMDLGMSEEEAIEYFEYNQGGAYVGEQTPIYINRSNIEENR